MSLQISAFAFVLLAQKLNKTKKNTNGKIDETTQ